MEPQAWVNKFTDSAVGALPLTSFGLVSTGRTGKQSLPSAPKSWYQTTDSYTSSRREWWIGKSEFLGGGGWALGKGAGGWVRGGLSNTGIWARLPWRSPQLLPGLGAFLPILVGVGTEEVRLEGGEG